MKKNLLRFNFGRFNSCVMLCFMAVCSFQVKAQNVFPGTGNVGIGTTTPTQALHVVGSTLMEYDGPVLAFNSPTNGWLYSEYYRNHIRQAWMGLNGSNDFYIAKETQGNIVLNPTNGNVVMNAGGVGINTSTITGHLSFGSIGNHITIGNPGFTSQVILATGWTSINGDFTDIKVPGTDPYNSALLRIQSNGNVGIGTDKPGSYKLAVEGKIAARGVKVTTTAFADYVFDSTYQLRPLARLEQYINQNKHLPGIPSAEEVKKDGGVELGDMNVKLLEKIEEMSLYIIEVNKKLEVQQKEIEILKKNNSKQ